MERPGPESLAKGSPADSPVVSTIAAQRAPFPSNRIASHRSTSTKPGLMATRQELYERIQKGSKEDVILEEMVRLGFWPREIGPPRTRWTRSNDVGRSRRSSRA